MKKRADGELYDERRKPFVGGTVCTAEEGKTRQSEADQADVNQILERAMRGLLPDARFEEGVFSDVSGITDFHDAMLKVKRAETAFMSLDARVRGEFDNDPGKFLDAFHSDEGVKKLQELGVLRLVDEVAERDAAEAAVEDRAARRREAREEAARVEAARKKPEKAS